jgi:hypothetical protein
MRKDISERVVVIGHHGHAQAKRTSDAGGTAKTLAVSSARAVHADAPEANRKTEQKPATALSLMSFNANRRNQTKMSECNMREIGTWISVTDRLPESGKPVLIACDAEILCAIHTQDGWLGRNIYNILYCSLKTAPTHWMPLPECPQGEVK